MEIGPCEYLDVTIPPRGDHRETHMSQLILMIAKIDELDNAEVLRDSAISLIMKEGGRTGQSV
jgi:hypothetical protein